MNPAPIRLATLNLLYYPQGDRWTERRPLVEAQLGAARPRRHRAPGGGPGERTRTAGSRPRPDPLDYQVLRASETIRDRYPRHWDGVVLLVRRAAGEILFHEIRRLTHLRVVQAVGLRLPERDHADGRQHASPPSRRPAGLRRPASPGPDHRRLPRGAARDGRDRPRRRPQRAARRTEPGLPVRRRLPVRDARGRASAIRGRSAAVSSRRPSTAGRASASTTSSSGGRPAWSRPRSPSIGPQPTTRASTRAITSGWWQTSRSRPREASR